MKVLILILMLMLISCAAPSGRNKFFIGEPLNLKDRNEFAYHHAYCTEYATSMEGLLNLERYQICMERYGYQY